MKTESDHEVLMDALFHTHVESSAGHGHVPEENLRSIVREVDDDLGDSHSVLLSTAADVLALVTPAGMNAEACFVVLAADDSDPWRRSALAVVRAAVRARGLAPMNGLTPYQLHALLRIPAHRAIIGVVLACAPAARDHRSAR